MHKKTCVVVAFPILIIEREETHNKDKEEEDKNDENAPG